MNNRRSLILVLGALSAIAPLTIDMYLPALPQVAADIGVSEGAVQISLMAFFCGLMLGQLVYGPLSDRYGRKPLIYCGLSVYAAASFGCAFAADAVVLDLLRFVQGLGGSVGTVIAFAIVRDLFSGIAAAHLLSMVVTVLGIAPIVAPLIGNGVVAVASWRAIFLLLGLFGLVLLAAVVLLLPETRLSAHRAVRKPGDAFKTYAYLLTNRRFVPFLLATGIAQAGFFAYLAASPSVFITGFGLSSLTHGVLFAVNSIGVISGARSNAALIRRFGAYRTVRAALSAAFALSLALLCVDALSPALVPTAAMLFLFVAMTGLVMPVGSMLALDSFGEISGTASALLGGFQFGAGALASGLTGALTNGTVVPMAVVMLICTATSAAIAFTSFPPEYTAPPMSRGAVETDR